MTVLVRHDPGCKWGRFDGEVDERATILSGEVRPGHSDAAKRFADTYTLHRVAGTSSGWIAVRYSDGSSDGEVYDTRGEAVAFMWPNEDWYFYCTLAAAPTMSVCAAESVLRWRRVMAEVERPDRDQPQGGIEVIEFLTSEDRAAQERAARTGRGLLAVGHRTSGDRKQR